MGNVLFQKQINKRFIKQKKNMKLCTGIQSKNLFTNQAINLVTTVNKT